MVHSVRFKYRSSTVSFKRTAINVQLYQYPTVYSIEALILFPSAVMSPEQTERHTRERRSSFSITFTFGAAGTHNQPQMARRLSIRMIK